MSYLSKTPNGYATKPDGSTSRAAAAVEVAAQAGHTHSAGAQPNLSLTFMLLLTEDR